MPSTGIAEPLTQANGRLEFLNGLRLGDLMRSFETDSASSLAYGLHIYCKIVWPWVKGIDSLTFNVSNSPYRGKLPVSSGGCFGVPFGGDQIAYN